MVSCSQSCVLRSGLDHARSPSTLMNCLEGVASARYHNVLTLVPDVFALQWCVHGPGLRLGQCAGGRVFHGTPPLLPPHQGLGGTTLCPMYLTLSDDELRRYWNARVSRQFVVMHPRLQRLHAEVAAHARTIGAIDVHPSQPMVSGCRLPKINLLSHNYFHYLLSPCVQATCTRSK